MNWTCGCNAYYSTQNSTWHPLMKKAKRTKRMWGPRGVSYVSHLALTLSTFGAWGLWGKPLFQWLPQSSKPQSSEWGRIKGKNYDSVLQGSHRWLHEGEGLSAFLVTPKLLLPWFCKGKELAFVAQQWTSHITTNTRCVRRGQTSYWRIIWSHKLAMIPYAILVLFFNLPKTRQYVIPKLLPNTHHMP